MEISMLASFPALFLLMSAGGGLPNDLVSWLKPEDYFQSRKIDVSADKMLALADNAPMDGKSSLQQQLALRWLGDNLAETKKLKNARAILEHLAAGKKGGPQGFASEAARRTLALLDGKKPNVSVMTLEQNVKNDGLKWFPEAAKIF